MPDSVPFQSDNDGMLSFVDYDQVIPENAEYTMNLGKTERNVILALGDETLTLEQLAPKAGYEVSGHFRRTVLPLSKRGILGNKNPGYFVKPRYREIIDERSGA